MLKQGLIEKEECASAVLAVGSKTRPTRAKILARRREMINYDRLGIKAKDWISQVARKYGASEEAVKRDWSNRKEWMETYLNAKDTQSLVSGLMLEYDIAYEEACRLCEQEKNPKLKMQFIYLKLKIIEKKTDILKQIGGFKLLNREFRIEALKHARKLEEEWFPWMKGNIEAANKNLKDFKKKADLIATDILKWEGLFLEILAYRNT
jgi:hypothetical protein